MPLSPPPQRNKQPSEAEIERIINKGGAVAAQADTEDDTVIHISTRLTRGIVRQIDALRASRPRKIGSPKMGISLRDWIVEAVLEKVERDSESNTPT